MRPKRNSPQRLQAGRRLADWFGDEWLQIVCLETGRRREARELGQQARRLRCPPPPMTVSRKLELAGQDDEAAVVREAVTVSFGGKGCPSTSFLTPCRQCG